MKVIYNIMLGICFFALPTLSYAYVGPGIGLSALGSVIAFIGALFLLIAGFLWYPIKRLIKGRQANASQKINNELIQEDTMPKSPDEENK